MDLMALADALLLPDDDLALAAVLQEPAVRSRRRGSVRDRLESRAASLRAALRAQAAETALRGGRGAPRRYAAAARRETPFAFYAACSAPAAAASSFLARLGPEANDALDEFLNLALDYERRETPSLQGFVAWLRAAQTRGQARHGDRARRSARDDRARRQGPRGADRDPRRHHDAAGRAPRQPRLLPLPTRAPDAPRLVWAGRKDDDVRPIAAARAAARRARPRTNIAGCFMSR